MNLKICFIRENLRCKEHWRNQALTTSLQMGTLTKHCHAFQLSQAWFTRHRCTNLLDRRISASLSALVREIWNLVVPPHVSTENGQAPDKVCGSWRSAEVPSTDHQKAWRTQCHLLCRPATMVEMPLMGPQDKDGLVLRHRMSPDRTCAVPDQRGQIGPFLSETHLVTRETGHTHCRRRQ